MSAMAAAAVLLLAGFPGGGRAGVGQRPPSEHLRARLAEAQGRFDEAVASGKQGGLEAQRLYREALSGFQAVLDSGVQNAGLYYNLANTYLRLGDVGRAIAHYRRALRLRPGDPNIRKNLDAARRLCPVQFATPAASALAETLFFWHFGTSLAGRTHVTLAAYAAFWLLMLGGLWWPWRTPVLTWTTRCMALLCLITAASVAWDRFAATNRPEGVLVAEKVTLRKGNGEYYDPQFDRPLTAGVEFRLLETREDVKGAEWLQIQLPDGKTGWVRADQAEII